MKNMNFKRVIVNFQRNLFINKKILKISFFPNLFDPIITTLVFGGAFAQFSSGFSIDQIVLALMLNVGITSVTNEMTFNLFIQYKVQKSITSLLLAGNTLSEIFTGHILWSIVRGFLFSISYLAISSLLFKVNFTVDAFSFIAIVVSLSMIYLLFSILATLLTIRLSKIDYINIYISFFLKSLFLFSTTFFPVSYFSQFLQPLVKYNPFTYMITSLRSMTVTINYSFIGILVIINLVLYTLLILTLKRTES